MPRDDHRGDDFGNVLARFGGQGAHAIEIPEIPLFDGILDSSYRVLDSRRAEIVGSKGQHHGASASKIEDQLANVLTGGPGGLPRVTTLVDCPADAYAVSLGGGGGQAARGPRRPWS